MMNKLTLLVRDEEGMTLVELLAVIVILSIVAAMGGVAIAGVIQRSREDARVADVQMLYEAATLAESSDSYISKQKAPVTAGGSKTDITAKDLNDQNYATSVGFLMAADGKTSTATNVVFKLVPSATGGADKLTISIPKESTFAGSKPNADFMDKEAKDVKGLTRGDFFK